MDSIEKLLSLYKQLDRHVSAGEDVVADLRKEINNLELYYLKEEVLPQIIDALASKIKSLRCELDCSIQFNDEGKINYTFCTSGSSLIVRDTIDAKSRYKMGSTIQSQERTSLFEKEGTLGANSTEIAKVEEKHKLRFVDYSDKAFAVYGDSRHLSELFKTHGGYFNARLREGAGWVFSKKRRKDIETIVAEDPHSEAVGISQNSYQNGNLFENVGVTKRSINTEEYWLNLFKEMKYMPYRGYKSPHKAIFILSLIDCISAHYICDNRIFPTKILLETFNTLWKKFVPSDWPFTANFYQPYVHLSSESFYEIIKISERAKFDLNINWTVTQAKRYIKYGLLDEDLFYLLTKQTFANKVKAVLIETFLNQIEPSSEPTQSIQSKYESDYLSDFHHYLRMTPSKNGKSYSPSSINVYVRALKSGYIQTLIANITDDYRLDHVSIEDLERLSTKVKNDSLNDSVSNTVLVAFNLYISYRKQAHSIPSSNSVLKNVVPSDPQHGRSPNVVIKSILAEHIHITQGTPTSMFIKFVNEIGPDIVADMNIQFLGGLLVGKTPNPKYITSSKKLEGGYWLNTNSSTNTKIAQIKLIGDTLGIAVKIELQPSEESIQPKTEPKTLYLLNGHGPLNKRQTVLACVRLFMTLNPRTSFEVLKRNFPPELQGSYGVVQDISIIQARNDSGLDCFSKYFLDHDQIMKTKDGVKFAVCLHWGHQFDKFRSHVKQRFGWDIDEYKT